MTAAPVLGGLFSGIGGFELAWQQFGGRVAWMCEIDKAARRVLEQRFPGVPVYGDVEELDPSEVEPVDVLTGGSPCQGFSVAGHRQGLLHGESRLFSDYVRILDGLSKRGLRWALWENVPGVLSIKNDDGERTFPHVIAALAGSDEPVRLDPKRKWNAGVVAGAGRSVAWRTLDSRHFGVPQRRRRVYAAIAIGDTDGGRAGRAVLAIEEGLSGNPPACVTKGQGSATRVGTSSSGARGLLIDGAIRSIPFTQNQRDEVRDLGDATGALAARPGVHQTNYVAEPLVFRKSKRAQSNIDDESWVDDGDANTLNVFDAGDTRTTHAVVEPLAVQEGMSYDGLNQRLEVGVHRSLRTGRDSSDFVVQQQSVTPRLAETVPLQDTREIDEHQNGRGVGQPGYSGLYRKVALGLYADDGDASTLKHRDYKEATDLIVPDVTVSPTGVDPYNLTDTGDVSRTLTGGHSGTAAAMTMTSYGVRRLTPVECERLQAFPDGWTEPAGSDSARYRALGNAVTVSVPRWLFPRMMSV